MREKEKIGDFRHKSEQIMAEKTYLRVIKKKFSSCFLSRKSITWVYFFWCLYGENMAYTCHKLEEKIENII